MVFGLSILCDLRCEIVKMVDFKNCYAAREFGEVRHACGCGSDRDGGGEGTGEEGRRWDE